MQPSACTQEPVGKRSPSTKWLENARLSRAPVDVYFRDNEDLLFGIGERALQLFCDRLIEAIKPFHSIGALAISAHRRASVVDQPANPFVARFAVSSGYRSRARRAEGAFAPYQ